MTVASHTKTPRPREKRRESAGRPGRRAPSGRGSDEERHRRWPAKVTNSGRHRHAGRLDAPVHGGDRRALDAVLADPLLPPLVPLVAGRVLPVPDPTLAVLARTPAQFRAARIRLEEPAVG